MPNKQCYKQWLQENEPPWLKPEARKIVNLILLSYQKAFGQPLIKCSHSNDFHRLTSQELFACSSPVMAHSPTNNPNLIYVNASALQLWGRQWDEMVGMPSSLTAPIEEREKRNSSLVQALQVNSIKGYQGIRVDKNGGKFLIHNARIWSLWDEKEQVFGQAATFSSWSRL